MAEVVKIAILDPSATLPVYKTEGAAGADLSALENVMIEPMTVRIVRTGLKMEIPFGYEAQVRSRSSMAAKKVVVANSPGTIDSDYRGELMILLLNLGDGPYEIKKGDRVAQMIIVPAPQVEFTIVETQELTETERGADGLGSTGK